MKEDNTHIFGFNEDGHLDENSIAECAEWLKGELKVLDPQIKHHLEECTKCKHDVLDISELENASHFIDANALRRSDSFEETCAAKYSPVIKSGRKNHYWRVAAILVVLISVTSLTLLMKPKKQGAIVKNNLEDTLFPKSDTLQKELSPELQDSGDFKHLENPIKIESVEEDKYANNFVPNPGFESLVGAKFRSGSLPNMIEPMNDTALFQKAILHFYASNPSNEILEVQIIDNKGGVVKSSGKLENVSFDLRLDFDPGLYYWKLLGEDELYQVGKFILRQKGK